MHSDSYFTVFFNLHSLMNDDDEELFMYLFDICISSVVKCGFKSFAHFIEFF